MWKKSQNKWNMRYITAVDLSAWYTAFFVSALPKRKAFIVAYFLLLVRSERDFRGTAFGRHFGGSFAFRATDLQFHVSICGDLMALMSFCWVWNLWPLKSVTMLFFDGNMNKNIIRAAKFKRVRITCLCRFHPRAIFLEMRSLSQEHLLIIYFLLFSSVTNERNLLAKYLQKQVISKGKIPIFCSFRFFESSTFENPYLGWLKSFCAQIDHSETNAIAVRQLEKL